MFPYSASLHRHWAGGLLQHCGTTILSHCGRLHLHLPLAFIQRSIVPYRFRHGRVKGYRLLSSKRMLKMCLREATGSLNFPWYLDSRLDLVMMTRAMNIPESLPCPITVLHCRTPLQAYFKCSGHSHGILPVGCNNRLLNPAMSNAPQQRFMSFIGVKYPCYALPPPVSRVPAASSGSLVGFVVILRTPGTMTTSESFRSRSKVQGQG